MVSSLCVYRVPEVFDQDEDGTVEVIDADPPPALHPAVRSAARACPSRSIHIVESVEEARADARRDRADVEVGWKRAGQTA